MWICSACRCMCLSSANIFGWHRLQGHRWNIQERWHHGNVRIDSMKLVTKDVVNYHFNGILFGISFNRVETTKFCHWMYHVVWSITIKLDFLHFSLHWSKSANKRNGTTRRCETWLFPFPSILFQDAQRQVISKVLVRFHWKTIIFSILCARFGKNLCA